MPLHNATFVLDIVPKLERISTITLSMFEKIWNEIPEKYKLGRGESTKAIERAIIAAVHVGMQFNMLDEKCLYTSLKEYLKNNKMNVEQEHFDMIMKTLEEA